MQLDFFEYIKIVQKNTKHLLCLERWDPVIAHIHILGTMIYPIDNGKRLSWIFRTSQEVKKKSIEIQNAHGQAQEYSAEEFGKECAFFAAQLGGVDNTLDIFYGKQQNAASDEYAKMYPRGCFSGLLLHEACRLKTTIRKAFLIISNGGDEARIDIEGKEYSFKMNSFLNHDWKTLKHVAHLWAAYYYFAQYHNPHPNPHRNTLDQFFDCPTRCCLGKPDGFEGFLHCSDAYWGKAITFIPEGATKPLLSAEETWFVVHPYRKWSTPIF